MARKGENIFRQKDGRWEARYIKGYELSGKDIFSIIGPKRRNQMLALIPAMLLASLMEMVGLTMVVSICASFADSAWVEKNPVMLWLRGALRLQSEASLMAVILLALIALYALKLPYLAWENYMAAKFVRINRHELSVRLCARIVNSPYPFFTQHTTAELQNLLGQDTQQFSNGLNAYMQLFMEVLVVLGMGICLLLIDPAMTLFLAAGIMALMVLVRVILIRPIRRTSQRQRDANRRRWKWLHHMHYQDNTCVEMLKRACSTTDKNKAGFRGLYMTKSGKYRVMITFQKKHYTLGYYKTFDEAVRVRLRAEEELHAGYIDAFERYSEKAESDPAWAKNNPFFYNVTRSNGEFRVQTNG